MKDTFPWVDSLPLLLLLLLLPREGVWLLAERRTTAIESFNGFPTGVVCLRNRAAAAAVGNGSSGRSSPLADMSEAPGTSENLGV